MLTEYYDTLTVVWVISNLIAGLACLSIAYEMIQWSRYTNLSSMRYLIAGFALFLCSNALHHFFIVQSFPTYAGIVSTSIVDLIAAIVAVGVAWVFYHIRDTIIENVLLLNRKPDLYKKGK